MQAILDIIARHKAGRSCGFYSVCSAHPLVIEAALRHALRRGAPMVLIEATSNQVDQDGGYTGMTPAAFRDFVFGIASRVGLPQCAIVLGGDHLGPNAWKRMPAEAAMAKAEVLIDAYVRAGFRKIHLDCSMACADDRAPLSDDLVARRAARLCAVAERAWAAVGGEPPVYVIGTEVPVPGGAAETLATVEVTSPGAAQATIASHRDHFIAAGLADVFRRVIALVVQPGVEFDHAKVVDYMPARASGLRKAIDNDPHFVFEAHSTDYQRREALAALVRDHFAILKVGPGLTFALREALWALDAIEREWIVPDARANLRATALARMKADPRYWRGYYHSEGEALDHELQFSLSDRIRYYWPDPAIVAAQAALFRNLAERPPPDALISQYLPRAHAALRAGEISALPADLAIAHIWAVLDDYHDAVSPTIEVAK